MQAKMFFPIDIIKLWEHAFIDNAAVPEDEKLAIINFEFDADAGFWVLTVEGDKVRANAKGFWDNVDFTLEEIRQHPEHMNARFLPVLYRTVLTIRKEEPTQ